MNGMIPDIGKSDQPGGFLPEVETQSNRFETAVASARGENVPGDRIEAQRGMVADAVAKVRKAISEKQRDIEEQRRKEALGKVREFEELRDDDMDTLTQTSDWDRGKYQAFSRKIDNDAAKAKAAKEAGTGYDDLNARLQRAVDGFADLRRKFDALHPVLALSNNMNVPVTYYVNGIGYEVLPNGGMDIAMKPCANARITANVSGMLSPDYYETHEKVVELPGAGRVPFSDTPEFRGNPTVIVRNRNDVAITLSVDGGAGREVAAGNSIAIEGSPRSRCTIAYSAPENYEISGGIRAEATFGNAGTATDIFAPRLTLLPRRVRMVNPLAESVVWTVSAGERRFKLDAASLEFDLPDGVDAVSISADPPDEELESEYRPVTESVSGFRRSRVATPLRFRAEQDMDAVERNRQRRQEKLEKEYASLRRRIKYAWPSDPSKTEQVADWMSVAEAVAKAMDARFDGMRDPDEVADWLRRFEDCHPESLQDKHGRRRDLEERLRIIRGR
ncbi:MAG: hypothetical protein IKH04_00085 [Kiritimatiellae bacterium]|nr:hypothetical protein [Kiritimatiellia bacterium]